MSQKSPIILGIDPGTKMGWALCAEDHIINSGTVSFSNYADDGFGAIFASFRAFLQQIQQDHGPLTVIAYELPFSGFGAAITGRITTGMVAHILERCYMWKCRPLPVNVQTLKKFATGTGKAKKPEMILAAETVTGRQLESEHEADAIHIARWGWIQIKENAIGRSQATNQKGN